MARTSLCLALTGWLVAICAVVCLQNRAPEPFWLLAIAASLIELVARNKARSQAARAALALAYCWIAVFLAVVVGLFVTVFRQGS
jgi:hypothetical protein